MRVDGQCTITKYGFTELLFLCRHAQTKYYHVWQYKKSLKKESLRLHAAKIAITIGQLPVANTSCVLQRNQFELSYHKRV